MSWRDRAKPVEAPSASGWRSRAVPVESNTKIDGEPSFTVAGAIKNLKADVKENVAGVRALAEAISPKKMLVDYPLRDIRSIVQASKGTPFFDTESGQVLGGMMESAASAPGAVVRRIGELVSHPIKSGYEKPVTTLLDLASAIPVVGAGVRGSKAALAASKLGPRLGRASVRTLSAMSSSPEEAILRRIARPQQVKAAMAAGAGETPFAPLADELAKAVTEVGEKARVGSVKASEKLSKSRYLQEGAFTKDELIKIVDREKSKFRTQGSVVGSANKQAIGKLNDIKKQIKAIKGETVSSRNVKGVVDSISKDINWQAVDQQPSNLALERIRFKMDAKLKKSNPEYRTEIADSARQMRVFKRSQRRFGLEKEVGSGMMAKDSTVSSLKSVGSGKVPMTERQLRQIEKETGRDFVEKAKDIDAATKLTGGVTQGSRRSTPFTVVGATVGGALGGPIGAIGGGSAGMILGLITDVNGRSMAAKIIDGYLRFKPKASASEILKASPKLNAIVRYSVESRTPRGMLASYAASRSIPTENR